MGTNAAARNFAVHKMIPTSWIEGILGLSDTLLLSFETKARRIK